MFKSWKTTVLGAASVALSFLVLIGQLSAEDQAPAASFIDAIVTHAESILLAVTGLIGLFARDNDVTSEESGATEAARMRSLKRR